MKLLSLLHELNYHPDFYYDHPLCIEEVLINCKGFNCVNCPFDATRDAHILEKLTHEIRNPTTD